jgi:hypothetical protein
MKMSVHIFLFALIIGLFACKTSTDKKASNKPISATVDTLSQPDKTLSKNDQSNTDCVRGAAEPIIDKKVYPKTKFVLQPDSLTGIETVSFDNGDKLIIKNWGCEYYVLTFRFETSRFKQDTTNLEYWFRCAKRLVTEMFGGINAMDNPIDIKMGVNYLSSYIDRDKKNNYKNLKIGEEIDFGDSEIRNFVTVDRIEKLTDKKYAIEISFTTGPL